MLEIDIAGQGMLFFSWRVDSESFFVARMQHYHLHNTFTVVVLLRDGKLKSVAVSETACSASGHTQVISVARSILARIIYLWGPLFFPSF